MTRVIDLSVQPKNPAAETEAEWAQWADGMAQMTRAELFGAVLKVQSLSERFIEYIGEGATTKLDDETKAEITKAVELLQKLWVEF